MKTNNKVHCIICLVEPWVPGMKPVNSMVAGILLELFENFAKCMNWSIGKNGFDFNHDPFPFCQKCKVVLVELSNLSQEMDRILGRIKTIATNTAAKIVLSNLKKQELIINDKKLGRDEIEGLSLLRKLQYFRKQTVDVYSPDIPLKINNQAESKLKKRKLQEDKVHDKPVGLKFPKTRFVVSTEDNKIESASANNLQLRKKLPNLTQECNRIGEDSCWDDESQELNKISSNLVQVSHSNNINKNRSKNKKKRFRFRCVKCGVGCKSKRALEMHQLVICGKYNRKDSLIKINENTFSFDGLPFLKTSGGYSCGICGKTFANRQYIQFHIRKLHSGNLLVTNHFANNEDLVTDIKPPRWKLSCLLLVENCHG